MANNKALSLGIIFEGNSMNYGEGIGTVGELKKVTRGNGETYSYSSRQSILYSIRELLAKEFDWNYYTVEPVGSGDKKVIQYKRDVSIRESEEMDLFGYMKTAKKEEGETLKRSAVVRLSHATSLEPYRGDIDYLTNMGMAARCSASNNIANIENHKSLYAYTISADLSRIGVTKKDEDIDGIIEIEAKQKAKRVNDFLEAVKILNREIQGRAVNMSPLFIIGGLYPIANPYFDGRLRLIPETINLDLEIIKSTLNIKIKNTYLNDFTNVGLVPGVFGNENEIKNNLGPISVEDFFDNLKKEVKTYYGVS
ncbi:MAG: type I-B CRISPR-associated protein Cas7/Cst2/DevR [Clostridiales bacterium]|nr:type I-B CRISPR-associated protein Cas7/Cst2/DevR [Clostridiales bacterium]MCF8023307.1 type I-B CRISPR-associated protein Cas7/Cst2/DevR [Clostridiales bacterium]